MQTLYVSQQGCYLLLRKDTVQVQYQRQLMQQVQLPLLEQVLIFGRSQVTTSVLQACLQRQIPVAYLSGVGYSYGRLMPMQGESRRLVAAQVEMDESRRLEMARTLVRGKFNNSRVILIRQYRRLSQLSMDGTAVVAAIKAVLALHQQLPQMQTVSQVLGLEGAGAAAYFKGLGQCFTHSELAFTGRSRRPPKDPINAMLSFGYQVLWNHLLMLVELRGLNPYWACLHQGSDGHPALVSDLVEQFRAPLVDSLVLYLVNRQIIKPEEDFEARKGGCYLNESGRRRFLRAFLQRMNELVETESGQQPRWDLLTQQVRAYRQFCLQPGFVYPVYKIR